MTTEHENEAVLAAEHDEDDSPDRKAATKSPKVKSAKSGKAAKRKAKAEAKAERKQTESAAAKKPDEKAKEDEKTVSGPNGHDKKARVKFESVMARSEAVAYLEAVVEGLRKGAIKFRQGGNTAALTPAENVEVQVKARRKGDRESVSFELAWHAGEEPTIAITSN